MAARELCLVDVETKRLSTTLMDPEAGVIDRIAACVI